MNLTSCEEPLFELLVQFFNFKQSPSQLIALFSIGWLYSHTLSRLRLPTFVSCLRILDSGRVLSSPATAGGDATYAIGLGINIVEYALNAVH